MVVCDVCVVCLCVFLLRVCSSDDDDDDKFTPTKHLTPPPHHSSSRPAAAHTETETPLLHQKKSVGPVDGPPQPIWPIVGPPKLAPEGGPGPGGQSKGTWTLILARPHGVIETMLLCVYAPSVTCFFFDRKHSVAGAASAVISTAFGPVVLSYFIVAGSLG